MWCGAIYSIVAKDFIFKRIQCDENHGQYGLIPDSGLRILDFFAFHDMSIPEYPVSSNEHPVSTQK